MKKSWHSASALTHGPSCRPFLCEITSPFATIGECQDFLTPRKAHVIDPPKFETPTLTRAKTFRNDVPDAYMVSWA